MLNEQINLDGSLIIGEVYRSVFLPAVKGIESSYKKGVLGRVKQHLHLNGDTVGREPAGGKSPANKHGTCWRAYRGCVRGQKNRLADSSVAHRPSQNL